ncbi:Acyl-CoA synthetase family member 3, mitochondrial [Eumeta japonica]|uniref:Acyl-CoA synthetase family member 3, mitochondrial n=1 Tax=Eumeta variegata TaxID=151549 RepID=A0A4C1V5S7_EUMVA|nr:Acyl-CoA synthetase family member 3, mitochondrial [Eumeta japonica]
MDFSLRTVRSLNRLCKKPLRIISYKGASTTALKEQPNSEILNRFNDDIKAGGVVPVFRRAFLFPSRVALQDEIGIYTYSGLHRAASALSDEISVYLSGDTGMTVAYLCRNDASHVITQWAIWMSGNVAVPLSSLHPPDMIKYFITDSTAKLVICTQEHEKLLRSITSELSVPLLIKGREKEITAQFYQPDSSFLEPKPEEGMIDVGKSNLWYGDSDALIVYTSGTTSKPKGVVWTHSMLNTHISALHCAWQYSANDVVLHTLPLHHIHGQLNSLNASLAAGARIRMLPSFLSYMVWARLLGMGEREDAKITVFHGVPAMYNRLVADHESMFNDSKTESYVRMTLSSKMRLMCVGSAPLPETLYWKWEKISGIRLLERYGMSEVGMALSNPYKPAERRVVGSVGLPLPGISARIAVQSENDPSKLTPLVTVQSSMPDEQRKPHEMLDQTAQFRRVGTPRAPCRAWTCDERTVRYIIFKKTYPVTYLQMTLDVVSDVKIADVIIIISDFPRVSKLSRKR